MCARYGACDRARYGACQLRRQLRDASGRCVEMQSHRLWEVELATAAQERCERVRRCDQVEPRCAEQRARGRAACHAGGADRPSGGPEAARQLVPDEARNQRLSEAIRGHQRPSEVIRGHQRSSEVIMCSRPPGAHTGRGHQRLSEVIRVNQS